MQYANYECEYKRQAVVVSFSLSSFSDYNFLFIYYRPSLDDAMHRKSLDIAAVLSPVYREMYRSKIRTMMFEPISASILICSVCSLRLL